MYKIEQICRLKVQKKGLVGKRGKEKKSAEKRGKEQ